MDTRGWRAAHPGASSDTAQAPGLATATPMPPPQPVRRLPEWVVGTGFVLYVEDDEDLREAVVELVTAVLQRRCVGVGSYQDLEALGDGVLSCSVAILDISLGANRKSGIDAYAWLRKHGYTGRVVFLTGHANMHPLVVEAHRVGEAEIFCKPVDPDLIRSIVEGHRP